MISCQLTCLYISLSSLLICTSVLYVQVYSFSPILSQRFVRYLSFAVKMHILLHITRGSRHTAYYILTVLLKYLLVTCSCINYHNLYYLCRQNTGKKQRFKIRPGRQCIQDSLVNVPPHAAAPIHHLNGTK